MLDQGLGSVRLLGSGTDACSVDERVLQLGREETDKLHTLGEQHMGGSCNCEFDFSRGDDLQNAVGGIWLSLGLYLLGDPKAI